MVDTVDLWLGTVIERKLVIEEPAVKVNVHERINLVLENNNIL